MPAPTPTEDLLDLRMLPAWANEPSRPNEYSNFEGEDADADRRRPRDRDRRGPRRDDKRKERPDRDGRSRRPQDAKRGRGPERQRERGPERERQPEISAEPLAVTIRFLPNQRAFENVIA